MTVHRAAGGRLGRWSAGVLVTAVLAVGAGACGADSNDGTSGGRGAAIYGANCASCHGGALEGTTRGPSLLDPVYDEITDADVRTAVRNGVEEVRWEFGPMPATGGLSDRQIDEVVVFLRASRSAGVSVTNP